MKLARALGLFCLTTLGTAIAACGSSSDGGFSTGVDSSKQLDELNDDEVMQVCEATVDGFQDAISILSSPQDLCTMVGVVAAAENGTESSFTNLCEGIRDACLDDPPEISMMDLMPDFGNCDSSMVECNATVGEFEACMGATLNIIDEMFAPLRSCSGSYQAARDASMNFGDMDIESQIEDLPECNAVQGC